MRDAKERRWENQQLLLLEAEMGVEPIHVGFADQCLPTWLLRRYRQQGNCCGANSTDAPFLVVRSSFVNPKSGKNVMMFVRASKRRSGMLATFC